MNPFSPEGPPKLRVIKLMKTQEKTTVASNFSPWTQESYQPSPEKSEIPTPNEIMTNKYQGNKNL